MAVVEFSGAIVYILGGVKKTEVPGTTLRQVLAGLEERYPALSGTFIKREMPGSLYLVYVNGMDSRLSDGLDTVVKEDDRIKIMNALTGG